MKLYFSSSSPFARKVRVVAREKGLASAITEIECNPFSDPPELKAHNRMSSVGTIDIRLWALSSGGSLNGLHSISVIAEASPFSRATTRTLRAKGDDEEKYSFMETRF